MSARQPLNRYTCRKCGGKIVTQDVDEGVTPFMLRCRATKGCIGSMESSCYRGVGADEVPDFIWRKPTPEEYRRATVDMKDHFDQGGLDIFPSEIR